MEDLEITIARKLIAKKKVLDIGCVGQVPPKLRVHKLLMSMSPSLILGMDTQAIKENIPFLNQSITKDVSNIIDSFGLFDVIIFFEVIEHLDNVGLAMNNIKNLLAPKGKVIITTPNPLCDKWLSQKKKGGCKINPDHVAWFCSQTLSSLCRRYNLTFTLSSPPMSPRLIGIINA